MVFKRYMLCLLQPIWTNYDPVTWCQYLCLLNRWSRKHIILRARAAICVCYWFKSNVMNTQHRMWSLWRLNNDNNDDDNNNNNDNKSGLPTSRLLSNIILLRYCDIDVIWLVWQWDHLLVTMAVTDSLASIWRQITCNYLDKVGWFVHIRSAPT